MFIMTKETFLPCHGNRSGFSIRIKVYGKNIEVGIPGARIRSFLTEPYIHPLFLSFLFNGFNYLADNIVAKCKFLGIYSKKGLNT